MTQITVTVDIAIIGGGIAGLWLLNRLCNQGYNAILFEHNKLGSAQTMASQGMIHGGIKYALGGALTGASEAIADMPKLWRQCLKGEGDVDLRAAQLLSDHFYLWSTQSITSKITSFFASKLSQGRVDHVKKNERPDVFQNNQFKGKLYRLVDLVLDVPSVVTALKENYSERIFSIDWQHSQFEQNSDGHIERLSINNTANNTPLCIQAKRFVLSAGEGNEDLLNRLDCHSPLMQRRPLRQVLVKHKYPYALYAHCMGSSPSPRLTISSHALENGQWVWYLGGDLATHGATLTDAQVITKAQDELRELFPWLDFSDSEWATLYINRAEPKQKGLIKPDKAFVVKASGCDNLIVSWPTKLTLAPNMANEVCQVLHADKIMGDANPDSLAPLHLLEKPVVDTPSWKTLFSEKKI
ncbi:FAD-dependent oxidoreductase [bacterium AH-315-K03]|nr:FAD-dependent oxidoreductase [bacterium AH-315-K03]